MGKRYLIAIHNLIGERLCVIYDSEVDQIGSAQDIRITKQVDGWKELEFTINTHDSRGEENYRCQYIKNENLLYVTEDDDVDVYYIKAPAEMHEKNKM